jgi:hypothetical protein
MATKELNTVAPKKYTFNCAGTIPTQDISDDILVGDFIMDSSTSPIRVWHCLDNTEGAPVYVAVKDFIVDEAGSEDLDLTWSASKIIEAIRAIPSPSTVIDDDAGSEDLDKTWSAPKIIEELAGAGGSGDFLVMQVFS